MTLGKGTRKELRLAVRAIRAARTHLKNARCGIYGDADAQARWTLIQLGIEVERLRELLGAKTVLPFEREKPTKRGVT